MIENWVFGPEDEEDKSGPWGDDSNMDNYANQHNPNHEPTN